MQPGKLSKDFDELLERSFCSSFDKPRATPLEMPPFTRMARNFAHRVYELVQAVKMDIANQDG